MRDDILNAIYAAIDEVNSQLADAPLLRKAEETRLLGGEDGLDSLTFVNLVVAVEEQIESRLGQSVILVNEDSMSLQESPFRTIGSLAEYIGRLVPAQAV